jgi:hypothetical protein
VTVYKWECKFHKQKISNKNKTEYEQPKENLEELHFVTKIF